MADKAEQVERLEMEVSEGNTFTCEGEEVETIRIHNPLTGRSTDYGKVKRTIGACLVERQLTCGIGKKAKPSIRKGGFILSPAPLDCE